MSFITDIVKYGLGRFGIQARGDTPRAIATSAIQSFVTQKINGAIKKANPLPQTGNTPATAGQPASQNSTQVDRIERVVRQEITADTDASIPVVYGEAWVEPILVDAHMSADNCKMFYVLALCEKTGDLLSTAYDPGDGSTAYESSEITFEEVRWNGKKITVQSDGNTVRGAWEDPGPTAISQLDRTPADIVKIYLYNGGSESPTNIRPLGRAVFHGNAYDIVPNWRSQHQMSNLVFAVIRIDYDKQKEITGIDSFRFKIKNNMTKPGDVLYDYMSNTVYGAGIPQEELD